MKSNAEQCPSSDVLCQLAAGELDEAGQMELISHLDECTHCRDALDRLTNNPLSLWERVRAPSRSDGRQQPGEGVFSADSCLRTDSSHSTALLRLIDQIKNEPPTTNFDSGSTDGDSPTPLDFLSPTDDPTHLGRLGRYVVQEEIG